MSQPLLMPDSIADSLPSVVRSELVNYSPQEQEMFVEEFRRKAKSKGVGFLLWLFGLHYAYVAKWGLLIAFLFTMGGFFIWWIVDLFRVPGIIRDYNKDVAMDVLRNIKLLRR